MKKLNPRVVPYLVALATMIPTYAAARWVTSQLLLAVALTAMMTVASFLACRLVQLRARISMGILVIGIPLLLALAFTSVNRLRPFIVRQRSINLLREYNVDFHARHADRVGELVRDQSGNFLPTWVADRIGPDCMREVGSIEAELADLQSMPLDQLDTSRLRRVYVHGLEYMQPVSIEFVKWINGLELKQLHLQLSRYTDADIEALSMLTQKGSLTLDDLGPNSGDLATLPPQLGLYLQGIQMTREQAAQVVERMQTGWLTIRGCQLNPELVEVWQRGLASKPATLSLNQLSLDTATWQAFREIPGLCLNCYSIQIEDWDHSGISFALDNGDPNDPEKPCSLWVFSRDVDASDIRKLADICEAKRLKQCRTFSEDELQQLWQANTLESIEHYDSQGKQWVVL